MSKLHATWRDHAKSSAGYAREHAQSLEQSMYEEAVDISEVLSIIDHIRKSVDLVENMVLLKEVGPR